MTYFHIILNFKFPKILVLLLPIIILIIYMPLPFRMWVIMVLHSFLSFVSLNNLELFTIFSIHSHRLIACCFPLLLLSIIPVSIDISKTSFLTNATISFWFYVWVSFLFPFSLKSCRCSHVHSMEFSASVSAEPHLCFSASFLHL